MNNQTKISAIRIAGIIVTAAAIPVSLLMLLAMQGMGGIPLWETIFSIGAVIVNIIAIIIILIGFIARYKLMFFLYTAAVHFVLFITMAVLILTNAIQGDTIIPLMLALPSGLYILGWLFQKK